MIAGLLPNREQVVLEFDEDNLYLNVHMTWDQFNALTAADREITPPDSLGRVIAQKIVDYAHELLLKHPPFSIRCCMVSYGAKALDYSLPVPDAEMARFVIR